MLFYYSFSAAIHDSRLEVPTSNLFLLTLLRWRGHGVVVSSNLHIRWFRAWHKMWLVLVERRARAGQ